MARFSKALALLNYAALVAGQATTSPEPEIPEYFADYGMVLSLNPSGTMPVSSEYPVVPLTKGAGLNATTITTLDVIPIAKLLDVIVSG